MGFFASPVKKLKGAAKLLRNDLTLYVCAHLNSGHGKGGEYVITTTAATNSWFFEICEVGGIGCLFFMARGQYSIDMYETSCNLWGYVIS